MVRKAVIRATLSLLVLAGCGDDGGDGTPTGAGPSDTGGAEPTSAAPGAPAGAKGGTITIDGTTYAFVANQQCGIYDTYNQYYISGDLPEVDDGYLAYTRDEGTHMMSVDIDDVSYSTWPRGEIDSTISGNVVTGTATMTPDNLGDPVQVEFRFEC
jgi:hypothetical protein